MTTTMRERPSRCESSARTAAGRSSGCCCAPADARPRLADARPGLADGPHRSADAPRHARRRRTASARPKPPEAAPPRCASPPQGLSPPKAGCPAQAAPRSCRDAAPPRTPCPPAAPYSSAHRAAAPMPSPPKPGTTPPPAPPLRHIGTTKTSSTAQLLSRLAARQTPAEAAPYSPSADPRSGNTVKPFHHTKRRGPGRACISRSCKMVVEVCVAPSGLQSSCTLFPRALPWATISRPFGASPPIAARTLGPPNSRLAPFPRQRPSPAAHRRAVAAWREPPKGDQVRKATRRKGCPSNPAGVQ